MTTPSERREAMIRAMEPGLGTKAIHRENTVAARNLDLLLTYFDNHEDPNERALGQALRYGGNLVYVCGDCDDIVDADHARSNEFTDHEVDSYFSINTLQNEESRDRR